MDTEATYIIFLLPENAHKAILLPENKVIYLVHCSFDSDCCKGLNYFNTPIYFLLYNRHFCRRPFSQHKFYLPSLGKIIADPEAEFGVLIGAEG